jgi:hypothetical protein
VELFQWALHKLHAEFKWVSLQGVVTPVDMHLIGDQLERFADSSSHMLHAKIVGVTRYGVVALASKKSPADIVHHAGNLRKSAGAKQQKAAGAKAAIHVVGKSAALLNLLLVNIIQLLNLLLVLQNLLLLNLLQSDWWPHSTTTLQNLMMAQMFSLKHMMLLSTSIARRGYK